MNDVAQSMSRRIAELEAENAALKARLAEAERWKDRARAVLPLIPRTVGTDLAAEVSWLLRAADSAGGKP